VPRATSSGCRCGHDLRLKKQLGKEGWMLGDRAVKRTPNELKGHYFAAIGIGAYSKGSASSPR